MDQDNSLCVCPYCGNWQEATENVLKIFGHPDCCEHPMILLDRNLILTIATVGLPKLIDSLGKEITKDI